MKKVFIGLLFIVLCCFIFYSTNYKKQKKVSLTSLEQTEERIIFISYLDYSPVLKGKSSEEQKETINLMINNIKESKFNGIILQVRSFADSIYKSNYFPTSNKIVEKEGDELYLDILDYFISKSHENDLKLYAWVNPYRIRSTNDVNNMNKNTSFYSWLNTDKIEVSSNGIYFNPADNDVLNLILNGVREIVSNYKVDGILYDDYFYPDKTIDLKNYDSYVLNGGKLDIDSYRRENINNLIKKTYEAIKSVNKNVLFGISPAGNVSNNYNEEYLDIEYLLEQENYLDFIMPQIYYGFLNNTLPFVSTIEYWNSLIKNSKIKLYVALALYKSGTEDNYAGNGSREWMENADIIKKQIIVCRTEYYYEGFSIFRYNYYFNPDQHNQQLIDEVKNVSNMF